MWLDYNFTFEGIRSLFVWLFLIYYFWNNSISWLVTFLVFEVKKKIIKDITKVKGAIGEERVLQNQYCDWSSKFFQTFNNLNYS